MPGSRLLPGGSGDEGGDDVGGVPVQRDPGPVVAHGGSGVGVGGGFLHVPERHACVERRGDEPVRERVWPDGLGDPGAAGYPVDDPGGAVPVQPTAIGSQQDGPFTALADGQVDRPGGARGERDGDDLAALRVITRVRCPRSTPRA